MKETLIRAATLKDAAEIADLHVRAWQSLYGGLIDAHYLKNMKAAERLETWKANIKKTDHNYAVFVSERNGAIIGFSTLGFSDEGVRENAELYSIYLDPATHGRGIGAALFRHSLSWAQDLKCRTFSAWVFKTYLPGHEFYKHMGGRLISSSEKDLVIGNTPYPIVSYEWGVR